METAILDDRCTVCGDLLDEEDLFCANCGTETPIRDKAPPARSEAVKHSFSCQGCGASMSYDPAAQTLRCPFCGSEKLDSKGGAKTLRPHKVVPFTFGREKAIRELKEWLGRGFWRPGDLRELAVVEKMQPVYVPYWAFRARTHTYWTADTSETPYHARGDWLPLFGEHRSEYEGLLVGASSVLAPAETDTICPFDLAEGKPFHEVEEQLSRFTVETFGVRRKYARPLARRGIETLEAHAVDAHYVPGRSRNLKVNTLISDMSSEPILLPVWVVAYRYKAEVYRFLMNGQTGRFTGRKPVSTGRILAAIGIGIAIVVAIIFLVFICGGLAAVG